MIDYNKLRAAIQKARRQQITADKSLREMQKELDNLGIVDLSRFSTGAENAGNIEEAIYCYIHYGEYNVDSLIEEIKNAEASYQAYIEF